VNQEASSTASAIEDYLIGVVVIRKECGWVNEETSQTAAVAAVAPPLEEALNRATTLYVDPAASYLAR
jgi:hypothetical protein